MPSFPICCALLRLEERRRPKCIHAPSNAIPEHPPTRTSSSFVPRLEGGHQSHPLSPQPPLLCALRVLCHLCVLPSPFEPFAIFAFNPTPRITPFVRLVALIPFKLNGFIARIERTEGMCCIVVCFCVKSLLSL